MKPIWGDGAKLHGVTLKNISGQIVRSIVFVLRLFCLLLIEKVYLTSAKSFTWLRTKQTGEKCTGYPVGEICFVFFSSGVLKKCPLWFVWCLQNISFIKRFRKLRKCKTKIIVYRPILVIIFEKFILVLKIFLNILYFNIFYRLWIKWKKSFCVTLV